MPVSSEEQPRRAHSSLDSRLDPHAAAGSSYMIEDSASSFRVVNGAIYGGTQRFLPAGGVGCGMRSRPVQMCYGH